MKKLIALACAAALGGCALNPLKLGKGDERPPPDAPITAQQTQRKETPEFWRKNGKAIAKHAQKGVTSRTKAKNLILFVGDGMGVSTVTAARILAGQKAGVTGEETELSFETFPSTALAKTYNFDLQTPQSAGSMTALLTGLKTRGSSVALDQIPLQGDCKNALGHQEPTILEQAKDAGMAAGLVTTARITHASAAVAYAHASSPNWEIDANVPDSAVAEGCIDIARQLTQFNHKGPLDVVFGGGRMAFIPFPLPERPGSAKAGVRRAPGDLIDAWVKRTAGRTYVHSGSMLRGLRWKSLDGPVLGLFAPDHMEFEALRLTNGEDEPSLTEMTVAAIQGLRRNKNGYVLVVVAAGIGRGHDKANAYLALNDAVELSNAVAAAEKLVGDTDTLIVVTASHGSTLTIGGAPARASPILGAAASSTQTPLPDAKGDAYATLAYGNGPPNAPSKPPPAAQLWKAPPPSNNNSAATYQQPFAIALPVAANGGEDVPVYARGPGSQWFHGTLDQHALYWIMHAAVPTLENGKPIRKIVGITPPKAPKIPLPFGKKDKKKPEE